MWTDTPVCMCESGTWGRGGYGLRIPIRYSVTQRYTNLVEVVIGLVALCGPIYLCTCVSQERGDGEGTDSKVLFDTLRYINLTEVDLGMVVVDRYTCVHV